MLHLLELLVDFPELDLGFTIPVSVVSITIWVILIINMIAIAIVTEVVVVSSSRLSVKSVEWTCRPQSMIVVKSMR